MRAMGLQGPDFMDWYSRYVVDADFCVEALEEALGKMPKMCASS